ncbi:hypothetical protein BST36_30650, partial [Mycolicibacterium moriokaense]
AQAFNVRQILDDAIPETPRQRRDLLTRVVVAAAKADRELEAQLRAVVMFLSAKSSRSLAVFTLSAMEVSAAGSNWSCRAFSAS